MIDIAHEHIIALSKAARLANPTNPPHVATLWRWANQGVRGKVLETLRLGGRRYTSSEAAERFLLALNSPDGVPTLQNSRAIAAGKRLEEMGC